MNRHSGRCGYRPMVRSQIGSYQIGAALVHLDQRWKHLQKIPASIKFISYEPALGALRLPAHGPFPDWLISGGESGGGARPVKRRWIRDVIADCRQHGVAPFHKQWGVYQNNPLVVN